MRTVHWFVFWLMMLLQIQFSLCHRKWPARPAATDKAFYLKPKLTDPTNQPSLYLIDSGRVYKLVKRVDEKAASRTDRADHQSDEPFDKLPELIGAIQSELMAESDLQSNENYVEQNYDYNQIDKVSSSGYLQTDQHSNDYYRYSDIDKPNDQPHSSSSHIHRPYSQPYVKPYRPYKPIYVTHPDKVNPLLILSQDTIRLQEEILLAMMPHFLRSHLIRIMDGHMGKLKGSKNTQYDPDHAWFGKGILMKAKKPY